MPKSSTSHSKNSYVAPCEPQPEGKVMIEKVDESDKVSRLSRQQSWLRCNDRMSFQDLLNDQDINVERLPRFRPIVQAQSNLSNNMRSIMRQNSVTDIFNNKPNDMKSLSPVNMNHMNAQQSQKKV